MARTSKNIKGFFKEKKNTRGISKSKSSKSKSSSKPSSKKKHAAAAFGSDLTLIDLQDKNEQVLKQFDMNMTYGPCQGMTRLDRWQRAQRLGLNPPKQIADLLQAAAAKVESS